VIDPSVHYIYLHATARALLVWLTKCHKHQCYPSSCQPLTCNEPSDVNLCSIESYVRNVIVMTLSSCAPSAGEQRNVASPSSFSDVLTMNDWRLSCVVSTSVVAGCNVDVSWSSSVNRWCSFGNTTALEGNVCESLGPWDDYTVTSLLRETTTTEDHYRTVTTTTGILLVFGLADGTRKNWGTWANQAVTPLLLNRCRRR